MGSAFAKAAAAANVAPSGAILSQQKAKGLQTAGSRALTSIMDVPSFASMNAEQIARCFIDYEKSYAEALIMAELNFHQRCTLLEKHGKPVITTEENRALFLNLSDLAGFHSTLAASLSPLGDTLSGDALIEAIGETLCRLAPFFRFYSEYIRGNRDSSRLLDTLRQKNSNLNLLIAVEEEIHQIKLSDMLRLPIIRLAQYLSFLGAIHDRGGTNLPSISKALITVQQTLDEISVMLRDDKQRRQVVQVQQKFHNEISIVASHRYVIRAAECQRLRESQSLITSLMGGSSSSSGNDTIEWEEKPVYLVLFNDMLIVLMSSTFSNVHCKFCAPLFSVDVEWLSNHPLAPRAMTRSLCFFFKYLFSV